MENWLGNSRTLDFSDIAHKLGATWAIKMFDAFQLRARRIPSRWPGTEPQAKRLASAYFVSTEDSERLADEVQRIAVRTWGTLALLDASASARAHASASPRPAAIAP